MTGADITMAAIMAIPAAFVPILAALLLTKGQERTLKSIVWLAARMMPRELREDFLDEWSAEVDTIGTTADRWKRFRLRFDYSISLLSHGPNIARANRRLATAAKTTGVAPSPTPAPTFEEMVFEVVEEAGAPGLTIREIMDRVDAMKPGSSSD